MLGRITSRLYNFDLLFCIYVLPTDSVYLSIYEYPYRERVSIARNNEGKGPVIESTKYIYVLSFVIHIERRGGGGGG